MSSVFSSRGATSSSSQGGPSRFVSLSVMGGSLTVGSGREEAIPASVHAQVHLLFRHSGRSEAETRNPAAPKAKSLRPICSKAECATGSRSRAPLGSGSSGQEALARNDERKNGGSAPNALKQRATASRALAQQPAQAASRRAASGSAQQRGSRDRDPKGNSLWLLPSGPDQIGEAFARDLQAEI